MARENICELLEHSGDDEDAVDPDAEDEDAYTWGALRVDLNAWHYFAEKACDLIESEFGGVSKPAEDVGESLVAHIKEWHKKEVRDAEDEDEEEDEDEDEQDGDVAEDKDSRQTLWPLGARFAEKPGFNPFQRPWECN